MQTSNIGQTVTGSGEVKDAAGDEPTRLTDSKRDRLMGQLERDGYVILPEKLPQAWMARLSLPLTG